MLGNKKIEKLINQFYEIESRSNLFRLEIRGQKVWEYVRYSISELIFSKAVEYEPWRLVVSDHGLLQKMQQHYLSVYERLANFASFLINIFRLPKNYEILVFNQRENRMKYIDGKYVDFHFYPLINILGEKYRIILIDPSKSNSGEHHYPCEVLSSRSFSLVAGIISKFVFLKKSEREKLQYIAERISECFDVQFEEVFALVRYKFVRQYAEKKFYEILFNFLKVNCILAMNNGNLHGLIAAAHGKKIPVIDVQHSTMTRQNVLYNYPENYDIAELAAPDYIFTFGPYWKKGNKTKARVFDCGYPYFESETKRVVKMRKYSQSDNNIIILCSGWSQKKLEQLAIDLAHKLPDGYKIFFRLRLDEYDCWRDIYSKEFQNLEKIKVIDNDKLSICEYFAQCRYQIGVSSFGVVEGMMAGLTTFILKDFLYIDFEDFIEDGTAFLFSDYTEIMTIILNKKELDTKINTEGLLTKDARTSLLRAMENVFELQ